MTKKTVDVIEHLRVISKKIADIPSPGRSTAAMIADTERAFEAGEPLVAIRGNFQINGLAVHSGDLVKLGPGASSYNLIHNRFFISKSTAEYQARSDKASAVKNDMIEPSRHLYDALCQDADRAQAYVYALMAELEKAKKDLQGKVEQRAAQEIAFEAVLCEAKRLLDSDEPMPRAPAVTIRQDISTPPEHTTWIGPASHGPRGGPDNDVELTEIK